MKPKEIKARLKAEIEQVTPDLSDRLEGLIGAQPAPLAEAVTNTGHRTLRVSRPLWAGVAALLVLILAALILWPVLRGTGAPLLPLPDKGFLTLDINPSVQLELDGEGKVSAVVALNDDARVLLAGQSAALVGLTSEQASQRIAAMAMECGYFAPDKKTNAVLLSASYGTAEQEEALKQSNKEALTSFFVQEGIYGVVLTRYEGDSLEEEAAQYGITAAKLRLIRRAESLGVVIPADQYADYSVAALYELIEEAAEEADRFGDEQLKAEYEALLEASEENLEEFADLVEDLIEEVTDLLEGEDEDDDDDDRRTGREEVPAVERIPGLEHTLELLEETAELLEDARTGGEIEEILDRIYGLLDQITGTGVPTADEKIALLKEQISAAHQKFLELEARIEEQLLSLEERRDSLVSQGSSLWEDYRKAEDFEELYEDWLEEAEELYEREWEKLKQEWELEHDD